MIKTRVGNRAKIIMENVIDFVKLDRSTKWTRLGLGKIYKSISLALVILFTALALVTLFSWYMCKSQEVALLHQFVPVK